MLGEIILAGRAFRNMLVAAARNPFSTLLTVMMSPLLLWKPVIRVLIQILIVVFGGTLLTALLVPKDWRLAHDALNLLFLAALVFILWRNIVNPMILHFGPAGDSATHGSADFASLKEITALTTTGAKGGKTNRQGQAAGPGSTDAGETGLLIGRDGDSGKLLRYHGPAHLLTMAPTRSGKGVGTIIPNLLVAGRSVVCVDPKGENARITAAVRQGFGPVFVLDPFGVSGLPSSAFNPLGHLDIDHLDVAEDVSTLADALVHDAPGGAGEAHWNEEAKALVSGVLLHVIATETGERRSLATLRECLTLAPDAFYELLVSMQTNRACNGLIARAANRHMSKSDREAAGVLSAAQRHTHFLDSPRMTSVLSRSDFSFSDLKLSTVSAFLVLPPDRIDTYSRWLRLMVTQSLIDMARTDVQPRLPVLYLLDEFAALGHLAPVERAMGLMAGYGVQLWPILQDIHQLKATYGQRAGTFLSNAGVLQVFSVNDHETAKLVSDLLGQTTVTFQTQSRNLDSEDTGLSFSQQQTGRPLLTPDEVRRLPAHAQLLFLTGQRPIIAKKIRYYEDREFRTT
ncbi:type IV secretory system conjugative DNA transfer family protein [Asticcacaulis sp. YBE204]|uniref:type IV secretory system conjugative DNA transfer family protein n=1 Tax=Asticcacaulis sp. YBE204 TaxID=1282363 RepID=UPI0003C40F88|nr:type IV secretory system conjugative DNA transfer family protein [Asticcacaulis sp. YBE204]ESQ76556.1 hypothetical protein AEYBE204_19385 [Asticcacaulis sp. YBE204]